jgi:hypothetical protein
MVNLILIFLYLLLVIFNIKNNKYWPLFVFFFIAQFWTIISVFYIERGIYITEQNRYSFNNGATIRLVIQNLCFFISALITIKFLTRIHPINLKTRILRYEKYNVKLYNLLLYFIFFIAILYASDAVLTSIKYGNSFSRFNYYEYSILYNYPLMNKIFENITLFSLLLGVLYLVHKSNKKKVALIIFSLLLIIGTSILQGSKFSAIYLNTLLFLIPLFTTEKFILNKKAIKNLFLSLAILIIFISLVMHLSVKEYSQTLNEKEAIEFVFYRVFGLQGHVWWGTDYLSNNLSNIEKSLNFQEELNAILLRNNDQTSVGLYSLMLLVSPRIGAEFIKNGISFTMGFPAILNTSFDTVGVYCSLLILGSLFGLFIHFFYRAIHNLQLIYILIFGYIYIYGMIQFFTMGRTMSLFNLKMYLLILLSLYIYICLLGIKKIKGRYKKLKF